MFNNRVNIAGVAAYLFLLAYKRALEAERLHYENTLEDIKRLRKELIEEGHNINSVDKELKEVFKDFKV